MKIRKNSLVDIIVKVIMVMSFVLMFGEMKLNVFGIVLYVLNLIVLWFTATIETYYVMEGRK